MVKNKVAPWVGAVPGGQKAPNGSEGNALEKDLDIKIKEFYAKNRRTIMIFVYCVYLVVISLTAIQAHGPGDSTYISQSAVTSMFARHNDLANYSQWPISPNFPRSYLDVAISATFSTGCLLLYQQREQGSFAGCSDNTDAAEGSQVQSLR